MPLLSDELQGWHRLTSVHGVAGVFDLLRFVMNILGAAIPGGVLWQ
jgi:hypothetical protein